MENTVLISSITFAVPIGNDTVVKKPKKKIEITIATL